MPTPNQAALEFLLSRRSRPSKMLTGPVPDRAALQPILQAALRSPDHKKLEPWRLIVLERDALERLAALVVRIGEATGRDPAEIEKQRQVYAGGELAIAVIGSPVAQEGVPVVEQVLSAGAVCLGLLNAALASGWGANWLSGWASHEPSFGQDGLQLAVGEFVAGIIHIGTETAEPPDRPRPDMEAKVSWMSE